MGLPANDDFFGWDKVEYSKSLERRFSISLTAMQGRVVFLSLLRDLADDLSDFQAVSDGLQLALAEIPDAEYRHLLVTANRLHKIVGCCDACTHRTPEEP